MARIKLGPNVTDIRGSIKEVVYSIWKSGVHYIRSKAGIIMNPQSADQGLIRGFMTMASKRWFDTLTDQQRANWDEYASGLTPSEGGAGGVLNIIPQNRGIMSGFNAYVMCYSRVRFCGIALPGTFDDSPLGATPPSKPYNLSVGWLSPSVTINWADPSVVEADSMVRVWLRSHENIAHAQLVDCVALATQTLVFDNFKGAKGKSIDFDDAYGHYILQLDCVQPNGLKSPPSYSVEVTVS